MSDYVGKHEPKVRLYGKITPIGFMDTSRLFENMPSIAETLWNDMHNRVTPVDNICLVFALDRTGEAGIFNVFASWKCLCTQRLIQEEQTHEV